MTKYFRTAGEWGINSPYTKLSIHNLPFVPTKEGLGNEEFGLVAYQGQSDESQMLATIGLFDISKMKNIASTNPGQGVFVRFDIAYLQWALNLIEYAPKRNLREYNAETNVDFVDLPACKETSMFMMGLFSSITLAAHSSFNSLLASKLVELFWLLRVKQKEQLDKFVAQYLYTDRAQLTSIVNNCYRENISLSQMASMGGYSTSTFKRKFEQVYKCSPKRWIHEKRLVEARSMVELTNKSISEIGYELGFENISHFIRSFRQRFGITPKLAREEYYRQTVER